MTNLSKYKVICGFNIRHILSKMIFTTNADRAWLIEFHNGSKNLTTGLPFLFGSMRIEKLGIVYQMLTKTMRILAYQIQTCGKVLDDGYFLWLGWMIFKK